MPKLLLGTIPGVLCRIILPGTEGMKGYGDYMFHLRGFLAGLVLALFISLVLAGIPVLLARII